MAKLKGWRIGGIVDVAGTAKEVEVVWRRFESRFPAQSGETPVQVGRDHIYYTKNGKTRRTRVVKLLEKLSIELGSLAGDVREVMRDASAEPMPKAKKRARK